MNLGQEIFGALALRDKDARWFREGHWPRLLSCSLASRVSRATTWYVEQRLPCARVQLPSLGNWEAHAIFVRYKLGTRNHQSQTRQASDFFEESYACPSSMDLRPLMLIRLKALLCLGQCQAQPQVGSSQATSLQKLYARSMFKSGL